MEQAAGWPCFEELEAERDIQRLAEEVRRDGLPKRVEYAEIGSVRLPVSIFDALRGSKGRGWTVGDVGTLADLLNAFELRDASAIDRASFEQDVLVAKGRELKFLARLNAPSIEGLSGSRVELDIEWLSRNGWFEVTREGGRIEVRLGPRAKALRKGES